MKGCLAHHYQVDAGWNLYIGKTSFYFDIIFKKFKQHKNWYLDKLDRSHKQIGQPFLNWLIFLK